MRFTLQQVLAGHPLPEVCSPYAFAVSPEQRFLAVAHSFDSYQTHLRDLRGGLVAPDRVDLYALPSLEHRGTLGPQSLPVNDLAFHPTVPLLAVASGDYDGGWSYSGRLRLWDIESGGIRSVFKESRTVLRCQFSESGAVLKLVVQPSSDPAVEELGTKYLRTELRSSNWLELAPESIALADQPVVPLYNVEEDDIPITAITADVETALTTLIDGSTRADFMFRPAALDLAWSHEGDILATRPGVALERWRLDGELTAELLAEGENSQIVLTSDGWDVFISRLIRLRDGRYGWESRGEVERIALGTLSRLPISAIDRAVLLSQDADGRLLARDSGYTWRPETRDDSEQDDVLLDDEGTPLARLQLGSYSLSADYLRIDGARHLYFVHREAPTDPLRLNWQPPWIARVSATDGGVERLFALDLEPASLQHPKLDGGLHLDDEVGEGLLLAMHQDRQPGGDRLVAILRRRLPDGAILWKQSLPARVLGLAHLQQRGLAAFSTDRAQLGLLDLASGAVVALQDVTINGMPVVLLSLAVHNDLLAAGALDGRILVFRLTEAPEEVVTPPGEVAS